MVKLRLEAYLALAAAFALGAISAAGGYHAYAERENARILRGGPEAFEGRLVRALAHDLDLDSDQTTRIRDIYRRHAPERRRLMQQTMQSCGAPVREHRARMDGELRAVLRPEQVPLFDAFRAEQNLRFSAPSAAQSPRVPAQ